MGGSVGTSGSFGFESDQARFTLKKTVPAAIGNVRASST